MSEQKGRKKRTEDDILEREETTSILDSSERTIDLDKRITKYQQDSGAGCFPWAYSGLLVFHFFHRLFNCVLIRLSRVDFQKKHSFKEKYQPTGDLRTRFPLWLYCASANPEVSNPGLLQLISVLSGDPGASTSSTQRLTWASANSPCCTPIFLKISLHMHEVHTVFPHLLNTPPYWIFQHIEYGSRPRTWFRAKNYQI